MSIYGKYKKGRKKSRGKLTGKRIIARLILSVFTFLFFCIFSVYSVLYMLANGPSKTLRNMLVLSANQASATKWLPSLFLEESEISAIIAESEVINVDAMSAEEYAALNAERAEKVIALKDEWEGSVNGVQLLDYSGNTFKAYVMLVKDPSRVFVGVSSEDFANAEYGMDVFNIASKYNAFAAVNGGEFSDVGGQGKGGQPIGLTYSRGNCVWSQSAQRTFIGFDFDNRLIVRESMSYAESQALGIRDSVMFQTGNVLLNSNENGEVNFYYESSNTGTSQRTAIGQRADGTVILAVTDGRSAASIGATHNDMVDLMVAFGAVTAGMLDGGSSSVLYCEDYFNIFAGYDFSSLDSFQQRGLVNKYVAFADPRTIPTYFIVSK